MSRRERVGASEIAAILGVDPYKTAQDLWAQKVQGLEVEDNEHMVRGRIFEPAILSWWEHLSGRTLRRSAVPAGAHSTDPRQVPLTHPGHPWAAATLDGMTVEGDMVVEAKCPASGKAWSEARCEHPLQYRMQVVWQIGVAQAAGYPVVSGELIAGPLFGRLQRHAITPDAELFALMLEKAHQFIECCKAGEPLPASFGGANEETKL